MRHTSRTGLHTSWSRPSSPSAGVFPRPSTLVFKEALVVVGLAILLSVLLTLAVVLNASKLHAQTMAAPGGPEAGELAGLYFRIDRANALLEAPRLDSDVEIAVHGEVARARVRQHFLNPSAQWMEGVYVFPLPQGSAVDRLVMTVGERRIEGRILPREEAKQVYETAAAEGRKASLLSGERPNVFVTSVANIGPGERVTIEIEYQDRVAYRDGRFELRFPTVVAPRYTPASEAPLVSAPGPDKSVLPSPPLVQPIANDAPMAPSTDVAPGRDVFGPVREPGTGVENRVALTVRLDAGLPLSEVASPTHAISVETVGAGRREVTLSERAVVANRDFVLAWTPRPGASPEAAIFAEQVGADSYLAVSLVPPLMERTGDVPPRELILVVDTSGSMHGPSLDQAKRALLLALDRLRPEDRFNVIRFDSKTRALFPAPRTASDVNLARAGGYVAGLEAEGGTIMRPALALALRQPASGALLRQIVFLTDGAVSNERELFATIARDLGRSRLFTVGLGSAPNGYFMRKAAEVGRGSFTFVDDVKETEARMSALFHMLENPVLTDVGVSWPAVAEDRVETFPAPPPDLYAGETVTFTARLAGVSLENLEGSLIVTGRTGTQPWRREVTLDTPSPAAGTAALWARAKIARIRDGLHLGHDADEVRQAATEVALAHRLVTPYTSLVAVDDAVSRPSGTPSARREVPRELPEGWSYEKVFGEPVPEMRLRAIPASLSGTLAATDAQGRRIALPQTATPAPRQALVGAGLAIIGLLLVLLAVRRRAGEATNA